MAGLLPIRTALSRPSGEGLTVPACATERDLQFRTQWLASEVVTVASIAGEVDATNVDMFLDYALRKVLLCRGLVLDLAGVTFFNSEGYSSLIALGARCATADVSWVLVPSSAVRRVLRICDVAQQLPVAESVLRALATVSGPGPEQSHREEVPVTQRVATLVTTCARPGARRAHSRN